MTATFRRVLVTVIVLLATAGAAGAADVPFVTGGVGTDERAELQAKEKDYNLKIVAAATSGAFVADVAVVIEAGKARVLEAKMEGPILLAKVPPGTYTVKATYGASTLTQTATVPKEGLREVSFRWPVGR